MNNLQHIVATCNTKMECLDRLGLEHTHANFRELNNIIRRQGIDTSHFVGIKVTTYMRDYYTPLDSERDE